MARPVLPIRPVRPGPGGQRAPFTPSAPTESRWILIVVGAVGLLVFFGLVRAKHGEARRARSSRDEVKWTAIDWVPPKLELSTFRKPGKVCTTLTPVEVAFFLEMPYKRILSVMLQRLTQAGFLEITNEIADEHEVEAQRLSQPQGRDTAGGNVSHNVPAVVEHSGSPLVSRVATDHQGVATKLPHTEKIIALPTFAL